MIHQTLRGIDAIIIPLAQGRRNADTRKPRNEHVARRTVLDALAPGVSVLDLRGLASDMALQGLPQGLLHRAFLRDERSRRVAQTKARLSVPYPVKSEQLCTTLRPLESSSKAQPH